MKKVAAIFILSILLFNWVGYRFVSNYFESRASAIVQASLDENNYDESELISLKVPLSLPYGPNSSNFQKVRGEVEINGTTYQYVKRRFYKDTLEVYCIPNYQRKEIKNARDEFFKVANDLVNANNNAKKTGGHHTVVKFAVDDYTRNHNEFVALQFSTTIASQYNCFSSPFLSSGRSQGIDQPPECIA